MVENPPRISYQCIGCICFDLAVCLQSGVCDIWNSGGEGEVGSTITSLALHPTEKLLLIAESHNVHVWNWKHSSQPQLYASSKWPCEKVRYKLILIYGVYLSLVYAVILLVCLCSGACLQQPLTPHTSTAIG